MTEITAHDCTHLTDAQLYEVAVKACVLTGLTDVPHVREGSKETNNPMLISFNDGWEYDFAQTPCRTAPNGKTISYLLLVVHQPGKVETAQYFYIGLGTKTGKSVNVFAHQIAAFIFDSQQPADERVFQYIAESKEGRFNGTIQESCWKNGGD